MEKTHTKEDLMELLVAENIRSVREGILRHLDERKVPAILGHAAIMTIDDDIRANRNKEELERVCCIVDTFHERVRIAKVMAQGEN
ncbi:hypothetical protein [Methanolobus psychrotolerans]|uniref:hypothetical protein n=1 Tax=Methanolobus psychrotolerans TaxID=1874706 RepID=UPI000B917A95|nr:hypothetical protein [Methanolobus psychrotolerans]